MKILIVGSGGREHAIAWKVAQSPLCTELYCAPGNPGTAQVAVNVNLPLAAPFSELTQWCKQKAIDLVVVGPERPLSEGIVDTLSAAGLTCFGPTAAAAQLESSKTFAKELMVEAGIPTAAARSFTGLQAALDYLATQPIPIVIKAAGLAEGKGVTVARTREQAELALRDCLDAGAFGAAGAEVLIEECLEGEEASMLAFADGHVVATMDSAQDHKPVFNGDQGPNTGGMGSYSPAPVVTPQVYEQCVEQVLKPCLAALRQRGIHYSGVMYAGLMITAQGPKVIEFNARFGDPETQALLPRLQTDLVEVMLACARGTLDQIELKWTGQASVCVIGASGGYPGKYEKGKVIEGLDNLENTATQIGFHAGTARDEYGRLLTAGGRVFGLTALDPSLEKAIARAYELMGQVSFEGMHYRTDIGRKALDRQAS